MALDIRDLLDRNRDLQERLYEAEGTLLALGSGDADAIVVSDAEGDHVYTLKGADQAYRMMVQNMGEGALILTLDGLILFSNEQFASTLGIPLARVMGSPIYDFIAAEDAPTLAAVLAGSAGARAEVRLKQGPQTLVPAHISGNRLMSGGTECVCLIVTDLSDQKRYQEMVAAERLASSILDQTAGAVLVIAPDGRIIRASRAAAQMFNGAVLQHHFDDVFCLRSDSGTKDYTLQEILALVRQCGRVAGLGATARMPDGRTLDVMLSASLLTGADSECLGCIVLLYDVSALKRSEEAVRQLSEQRGLVLEAAKLGAWDYRFASGDFVWDERCRKMYGIPDGSQMEYGAATDRIHPDDRETAVEAVRRATAGDNGGTFHREYRVVWQDHSVHWVASHGQAYFEGHGVQRRAARFLGVSLDITERRRAEERLLHMQKLESIGILAGGVAHDFNNLLTVIMGSASAALAERPSCEHSHAILKASERAAYLTRQLLTYAGKGLAVVRILDLSELVSQAGTLLSVSVPKRVNLSFTLAEDLPCLEADPSQIEQILMNLVINAGESILPNSDGRIVITTSRCEVTPEVASRHFRAFDAAAGVYLCLEVGDNGAGMDEATISRVFDPFFSTKFTGRGLGLAAVHGIVHGRRGFIDVHSSPGAGATFRVFLPASEKTRPQETAQSTA